MFADTGEAKDCKPARDIYRHTGLSCTGIAALRTMFLLGQMGNSFYICVSSLHLGDEGRGTVMDISTMIPIIWQDSYTTSAGESIRVLITFIILIVCILLALFCCHLTWAGYRDEFVLTYVGRW